MTTGHSRLDAAELAARHGLANTTARPALGSYISKLWQRRYFLLAYARARSSSRYTESKLGQLWQIFTPLLNAFIYFVLFGVLLDTRRGIDNFTAFLLTGVFVFTFTQRSLINGAKSINGNISLIRALHFPRAVLPLSFVLVELKQLLISMVLLLVIIPVSGLVYGTHDLPNPEWLLVVPAMALQVVFNIGIGLIMARIGAFSQDVNQLLPFISRLWFYMSGVFYSLDKFGKNVGPVLFPLLKLNPGSIFLELYRSVLITSYKPLTLPFGLSVWAVAAFWAIVVLVGGFLFFWNREEAYGRG